MLDVSAAALRTLRNEAVRFPKHFEIPPAAEMSFLSYTTKDRSLFFFNRIFLARQKGAHGCCWLRVTK